MVFELPSSVTPKLGPSTGQQNIERHPRGQNEPVPFTYAPKEGRRMIGNVISLSVAMMLILTAHRTVAGITERDHFNWSGISAIKFDILVSIICALFLPTLLTRLLSTRWVILIAVVIYGIHTVEQFYPTNFTSKIFQFIATIWSIPLWTAVSSYLSHIGHEHANLRSKAVSIDLVKFFGIFYFFYHISAILGAFIVGGPLSENNYFSNDSNEIHPCGPRECQKSPSDFDYGDLDPFFMRNDLEEEGGSIGSTKLWTVATLSILFALLAGLILFFKVDSLQRYGEKERQTNPSRTLELFFATGIQLKNPCQILLIPLTLWMSLEQCFFTSDYLINYVKCSWTEAEAVQYILISYGVAASLSSLSISSLVHRALDGQGRIWSMGLATLIHLTIFIVLLSWTPQQANGSHAGLSALSFFWGIADGIWLVELNALYGSLFHKKVPAAAFANYQLWRTLGTLIAAVIFNCFCLTHKLYFLLLLLALGLLGYGTIEFIEGRRNKRIIA